MVRPFRFALQAMELSDVEAVRAAAEQAEQLGYAQILSFDHIGAVDWLAENAGDASTTSSSRRSSS